MLDFLLIKRKEYLPEGRFFFSCFSAVTTIGMYDVEFTGSFASGTESLSVSGDLNPLPVSMKVPANELQLEWITFMPSLTVF